MLASRVALPVGGQSKSGKGAKKTEMPVNETILLAEDNQDDVLLLRAAFEAVHICQRLQVVRNGREAVDYLEGEGDYADRAAYPSPLLMLLDLKMPVLDGFGVLAWIGRHEEVRRTLKVVVLTDFGEDEVRKRAGELGVDWFVTKPLSIERWNAFATQLKENWLVFNPRSYF